MLTAVVSVLNPFRTAPLKFGLYSPRKKTGPEKEEKAVTHKVPKGTTSAIV
jgi:hypothetical protein